MPPSIRQSIPTSTHSSSGPPRDLLQVGFSPGKPPPTALIRIDDHTNHNCCSSIHDNNYPDNSTQSLAYNTISPSTKKLKPSRYMPYCNKKPAANKRKGNDDNRQFALFGPVPSATSMSLAPHFVSPGTATPPSVPAEEADLVLDDDMVFQELECLTNAHTISHLLSPPLSPSLSSFDDNDVDDFALFP